MFPCRRVSSNWVSFSAVCSTTEKRRAVRPSPVWFGRGGISPALINNAINYVSQLLLPQDATFGHALRRILNFLRLNFKFNFIVKSGCFPCLDIWRYFVMKNNWKWKNFAKNVPRMWPKMTPRNSNLIQMTWNTKTNRKMAKINEKSPALKCHSFFCYYKMPHLVMLYAGFSSFWGNFKFNFWEQKRVNSIFSAFLNIFPCSKHLSKSILNFGSGN